MMLNDATIRRLSMDHHMIFPFHERVICGGLSSGLSPAAYDVRIQQNVLMWPGRFVLASTVERVRLPPTIQAIVHDKSTWARQGLSVQNTVIDPGFEGYVTLELSLHAFRFLRIPAGAPICKLVFHKLCGPSENPYSGKYQNQPARPVAAIMEKG